MAQTTQKFTIAIDNTATYTNHMINTLERPVTSKQPMDYHSLLMQRSLVRN